MSNPSTDIIARARELPSLAGRITNGTLRVCLWCTKFSDTKNDNPTCRMPEVGKTYHIIPWRGMDGYYIFPEKNGEGLPADVVLYVHRAKIR